MALPKYFTEGKTVHKKSRTQEDRVAAIVGGKRQKGSGSQTFHKGDVKTGELLIEAKMTSKDSLSVKKAWLVKIHKEAMSYGRIPALSIEFEDMPSIVPRDWIAVPAKTLAYLIECMKVVDDGEPDA